jgi:ubiquinone/menaquinone biosynthesis C-methylase UbiE
MEGDSMTTPQPRRDPEEVELAILQHYSARSNERVLDIGCGDGRLTWSYGRVARMVTGIDGEFEKLKIAVSHLPESISAEVYFAAARGEALPLASETFDLAIFSWSL